MKKSIILCFVLAFVGQISYSQALSYEKIPFGKIPKLQTINLGSIEDPYTAQLNSLEAPPVSGENYKAYLFELKKHISEIFPGNENKTVTTRSVVDAPILINNFFGNNTGPGIPLDNHLAISSGTEQIVSVMNSHIAIIDEQGEYLKNLTLSNFSSPVNVNQQRVFDPRMMYDPEQDRFILVFLSGSESGDTNIVVGFSDSNDAEGDWHVYAIPGNPNENTTWTDYPMVGLTQSDFFITGNLIRDNESWQLGFDETLIWQIDKDSGYAGEELNTVLWQDISFEGTNIRNLCPVTSADEVLESNMYFLSNRNFSVETDSFFMVEITGGIEDPTTSININMLKSDVNYGVPPDGRQPTATKTLQTNDARVLEAIILNDEIQFVGNTRNINNNFAGIYHGSIFDVSDAPALTIEHLHGGDLDYGYPGISWTGYDDSEFDCIISFSHSGPDRNPGNSALYYRPGEGYSDVITVKEGETIIDMLNGTTQRWGDYSGSQRRYDKPGEVWVSASYGINTSNFTWIGHLARPDYVSSTKNPELKINLSTYPNPTTDRIHFEFELADATERVRVNLLDIQGQKLDQLFSGYGKYSGKQLLSMNTSSLTSGVYLIQIESNGRILATRKFVKE